VLLISDSMLVEMGMRMVLDPQARGIELIWRVSSSMGLAECVGMLIARFAAAGAKVASVGRKIKRARAAIEAFIRLLEDLMNAVDDLHNLGAKLVRARSKPLHLKGPTKTTLQAKKESIKRDKKCRLCGSTQHTTPRHRVGTVQYR